REARRPSRGAADQVRPRRKPEDGQGFRPHLATGASGPGGPGHPVAADHRMMSSARARSDGGRISPRALAVLRLMTSSYFVGCSTGRSADFTLLRILST